MEYLCGYAAAFQLTSVIELNTEVIKCRKVRERRVRSDDRERDAAERLEPSRIAWSGSISCGSRPGN